MVDTWTKFLIYTVEQPASRFQNCQVRLRHRCGHIFLKFLHTNLTFDDDSKSPFESATKKQIQEYDVKYCIIKHNRFLTIIIISKKEENRIWNLHDQLVFRSSIVQPYPGLG